MEERPEETRIDENEDVEGHKHHQHDEGKAVAAEDSDDVEAHGPQHGAPQHGAPQHGRNVNKDDEDDVEAHQHFGAPQHGKPQHG
jgi:hypothetical protein